MNTVSSSSSYSTKASTNKGFSGLVSGMDTESLVESMLSGTQTKIDKQNATKQQTLWKQDIYRDVVSQINSFQMKYFDFTSNTNLMSSSFFNTMSSVSSSSAVKVSASASAASGKTTIQVSQLATSASVKSADTVSGALTGKINIGTTFSVEISLDGIKKTITVAADGMNEADSMKEFQTEINKAFGSEVITLVASGDSFELKTGIEGRQIVVSGEGAAALGMVSGQSNKISTGLALKDLNFGTKLIEGPSTEGPPKKYPFEFMINDVMFTASSDDTLSSVMSKINSSAAGVKITYSSLEDKFNIESTSTGAGSQIEIKQTAGNLLNTLFGADEIDLNNGVGMIKDEDQSAAQGKIIYKNGVLGQNAKVTINGTDTERSANSFTVDGLNIELLKETAVGETITIDTTRSTDQILDAVKSFVTDYNAMLDKLNGLLDADATYQKYDPLTDAQKKEMSEKEIELWEKNAKEGLLRKDSTISGFLSSMRSTLYQKPDDAKFALYELGIETGGWQDKGKLVIKDEALLKQRIENNAEEIQKLFNDPVNGILKTMNTVMNETAKSSSASPGTLVSLAGLKGKASESQNLLSERIKKIEEKITSLKSLYEKQKARYWNQFNTMETMISNMSSQSSWLTQMFQ